MSKQDIEKRLGFAAQGVKAEMASIPGITDLPYEANPQGTHRYKVGDQVKDKRHPSFRGTIKRLMRDKYGHPSYVVYTQSGSAQDAQDSDLVLASRPGAKAKFVRIVTTPQGRYTTNLDKNTRAPIEGGKGYVMVDPAMYITPKRVRVQGTKGEIEVQAIVEGKEIVGVSAKLVSARPGAKAEMGFLSRVGYAATALTADPADPKSPEYRKQVSEAKAAAKDAITNYKFMRDKVKERLAALDAYVTNAIKVINSATSAKDIEHYVEQLRIAVKSQSMILGASKSPFSRPGAKAKFERYEIGDAFKFEDKIYVINSHANEINAVLSSADSNAKKALSLADFAHSKWLQFEGKAKSSRAGAKAKFGLSPSEMKENQRRIETNIRYEAGEMRNISSNMRFIKDEIERLTAEIKNTRDIKRKAQLSLKLDAENKKMKDQVAYLRRARQMIQENQADAKSLGITLDAKWAGNFARPGVKAKMSATFIVAEAIFNAENAVRRGDNENARRWIKAAQDAMDETVVSTGMRSKLEQLVKRYKMSRPGAKAKA